ncbi:Trehalose utilisation [Singulisphaera sp. GP187]|uniref:ThuA domain-containing protein n=1 Tax=Singulisphaera sp. GP187 TaxID=1882752 RepID=UPI00092A7C33|nr:ThuA domain-containing protein [Singulisphaera sp. GP187]SIO60775.1 Trehalose utilisation [Singulisphaera sp. GP187]
MKRLFGWFALCGLALVAATSNAEAADTKIVLIAGTPSHPAGAHEFNAGTKLLVKCLKEVPGIDPVFVEGGWPKDESVFQGAKSVVFFMDGGGRHPMIQGERLETMRKLMDQGVGLVCLHYAVEFPKGKVGDQILDWLGGYYETAYSDNPHNHAQIIPKSDHPITRGVKPFRVNDEWYFKIRFRPEDARVTPILTAEELVGHDKKTYRDQVVAWATERQGGGRAFGFTGGHFHTNWGDENFRTLVLNSILWSAKLEVPSEGIKCPVSVEELAKNLDPKGK